MKCTQKAMPVFVYINEKSDKEVKILSTLFYLPFLLFCVKKKVTKEMEEKTKSGSYHQESLTAHDTVRKRGKYDS